jgi:hypothetical protein
MKDVDTDLRLGRAGDPLYRDRSLVTGAVRLEDVRLLRWLVTILLVAINVRWEFSWAAIGFWIVFAVTWLSFQWFFWPAMADHLLVALATHNPISLLLSGYIVGLFADTFGVERLHGAVFPLLVGLWFPLAAWETARKIRAPEDETSYRTYSGVLGWKVAPFLPAGFALASTALLLVVSSAAGLGAAYPLTIAGACSLLVYRCVLFRLAPVRRHAELKPWAILYAAVANAGLAVAAALRAGAIW